MLMFNGSSLTFTRAVDHTRAGQFFVIQYITKCVEGLPHMVTSPLRKHFRCQNETQCEWACTGQTPIRALVFNIFPLLVPLCLATTNKWEEECFGVFLSLSTITADNIRKIHLGLRKTNHFYQSLQVCCYCSLLKRYISQETLENLALPFHQIMLQLTGQSQSSSRPLISVPKTV